MGNAQINIENKQATFDLDGTQYEVDIDKAAVKISPPKEEGEKKLEKLLYQTLALDHTYRKPGAERPLYTLSNLNESRWKEDISSYFTVSGSKCKKDVKLVIKTDQQFCEFFYDKYPMLTEIDMTHVFVGGGCVSSLLIDHDNNGDVDLFIHGCDDEEKAESVVGMILQKIKNWCDSSGDAYEYKIYKGKFLIKFEIYQFVEEISKPKLVQEIQIIFRLYDNPSEIINGFDIGSSSVGFDGHKVYFTEMAAYCYQNMVNVVDTWCSSPTFGNRLHKYAQRGFKILFPFIHTTELWEASHNICSFRDLTIKRKEDGTWVTGKKPKVVWNAYNKASITDAVINANVRIPYSNKEMKRFVASFTGYCTDVWYTPKLREGLFNRIKQLYYHNVKPELINRPLQTAIRYLGAENVGDFVMAIHNDKSDWETKKAKCAEIREEIYVKMQKKVDDYHKTLQVHKGIVWKMTNPVKPISSSTGNGVEPEEWYDVCFAKKYIPYYDGTKYTYFCNYETNLHMYKNVTYEDEGHPSHHNLFDKEAYAEYEKYVEQLTPISSSSEVGGAGEGLKYGSNAAGPVTTKFDEDNIKFI